MKDILTDFLHYLWTNHSPRDDRFQYPLIFTGKHTFSLLDLACMYKIWNTSFLPFPFFTYFAVPLDHHRLTEIGHRRILARKLYFKTTYFKLSNSPSSQSLEEKNTWKKKGVTQLFQVSFEKIPMGWNTLILINIFAALWHVRYMIYGIILICIMMQTNLTHSKMEWTSQIRTCNKLIHLPYRIQIQKI